MKTRSLVSAVAVASLSGLVVACGAAPRPTAHPPIAAIVTSSSVQVPVSAAPPPSSPSRAPRPVPVAALLKSLAIDRPTPTRVLLVGVSSAELVKALLARGHTIDVVEEDDARFAAAEESAKTKLSRCDHVPEGILSADGPLPPIAPCRDEKAPYGAVVVDCMAASSPVACARKFVQPARVRSQVVMYVAFSVDHHVSVRNPFSFALTFRTAAGFDVLAVPELMDKREVTGAEWSLRAQPFPGPAYDARDGRYYGCLISEAEQRIMPFERREGGNLPFFVVPEHPAWNRAPITRTGHAAAKALRDELLIAEEVGPTCFALWSFDAEPDLQSPAHGPARPYFVFQGLRNDVWPFRMQEIVATYTPHVEAATAALARGDVDLAIVSLQKADAVMDGGLGGMAIHTLRGFLVKELAHELAWAREHGRATDYARAVVRFHPYVKKIATRPIEDALVHAVAAFALSSLKRVPETRAKDDARSYLGWVFTGPERERPPGTPPVQDWIEGIGEY